MLFRSCITFAIAWGGPGPPPEGPFEFCPPHEADSSLSEPVSEILLDPSFGTDGKVMTQLGSKGLATTVVIQPDGKIIAAGHGPGGDAVLARYNTDGSLDATFGDAGVSTLSLGFELFVHDLALQADGQIVIAGFSWDLFDFVTTRFTAQGQLDTEFGVGGVVQTDFSDNDAAKALAIQPDGKILVGGDTGNGSALVRYHSDGSLDTTFGNGGVVVDGFGSGSRRGGKDIAIQDDGKIVVGGGGDLRRYNADGSLDASFGTGGIVARGGNNFILQHDGKIVALGANGLTRYNPDGSLDLGFGFGDGISVWGGRVGSTDLALDEQGNIVVLGNGFTVQRFTAEGHRDGRATTDFSSWPDSSYGVAIQADGSIVVVGGYRTDFFTPGFALARYQVIEPEGASNEGTGGETAEAFSEVGSFLALTPDVFNPATFDAVSAQQTEPDTPRPDAVQDDTVDLALTELTSDDEQDDGTDYQIGRAHV